VEETLPQETVRQQHSQPEIKDLRILIVDDNEVNRDVASMMLEKSHRVATASNGLEALKALAAEDFDLVLMDVQMPVMDGLSATGIIRAVEKGRALPIEFPGNINKDLAGKLAGKHQLLVAMTAHAMEGDREMCLASGMDSYITKPFQPNQLAELLWSLIANSQLWEEKSEMKENASPPVTETLSPSPTHQSVAEYLQKTTPFKTEQIGKILVAAQMSIAENLDKAEDALMNENYEILRGAAHTLKGTLLQCGMQALGAKAEEICQGIREDRILSCDVLLTTLKNELALFLKNKGG
jgi:CheY-like chemotaxis protein